MSVGSRTGSRVVGTAALGDPLDDQFGVSISLRSSVDADVVRLEEASHIGTVRGEETLAALGDTLAAPVDESKLGKLRVGILDSDKRILDAAVREFFVEIVEVAVLEYLNSEVVRGLFVGEHEVVLGAVEDLFVGVADSGRREVDV